MALARDQRTDRRIKAREVRVVGPAGEQLGVLSIDQALARAQEFGLNLVEVNPMSKPPVCKIMDYGRFKYEEKKRANEAKKKQVVVKLKEVKLRPKTEEHDYETKVRHVKEFLEEGNKAKITIMFRGREITHRNLGQAILDDVVKDTKDIAVVEQPPRMEGRSLFMIIGPNPKVAQRARDLQRQALASAEKEKQDRKAAEKGASPSAPRPNSSPPVAAAPAPVASPQLAAAPKP
ncbi:MAG: translation initiation factor IF-3 [Myxococcota bacterium]